MTPIDIIAEAIHDADACSQNQTALALARHVTEALTDGRILDAAVRALKDDGWEETHEGPLGVGTLSDDDLRNIARTVLAVFGGS